MIYSSFGFYFYSIKSWDKDNCYLRKSGTEKASLFDLPTNELEFYQKGVYADPIKISCPDKDLFEKIKNLPSGTEMKIYFDEFWLKGWYVGKSKDISYWISLSSNYRRSSTSIRTITHY
jgi:hypothetical protein